MMELAARPEIDHVHVRGAKAGRDLFTVQPG
jgi:hypothetical protein